METSSVRRLREANERRVARYAKMAERLKFDPAFQAYVEPSLSQGYTGQVTLKKEKSSERRPKISARGGKSKKKSPSKKESTIEGIRRMRRKRIMRASPGWSEGGVSDYIPWGMHSSNDAYDNPKNINQESAWYYRMAVEPNASPCAPFTHEAIGYKKYPSSDYCVQDCDKWDPPRNVSMKNGRCTTKIAKPWRPDGLFKRDVMRKLNHSGAKEQLTKNPLYKKAWGKVRRLAKRTYDVTISKLDEDQALGLISKKSVQTIIRRLARDINEEFEEESMVSEEY
jgi:hypothetical protein